MKKFVLAAVAAGGVAFGGAASAQELGHLFTQILGNVLPGVTQSYNSTYVDRYGRTVYVDQYGRHVLVQPNTQIYGNVTYDAWGRPIHTNPYATYGSRSYPYSTYGQQAYSGRSWDRDGDGVPNSRDRWPDDPRYW